MAEADSGRRAGGLREAGRGVGLALPLAAGWYGALVGTGLLLGGPLATFDAREDVVMGDVEALRTPTWDAVTHAVSWTANTATIVLGALVVGLVLRLVLKSWVEPALLWAGVALQSSVFLLTTLVVSRDRPDVTLLDPAPPTSSFPSGHTGASTALWLGLALVLADRIERRPLRVLVLTILMLAPAAVGLSRLYRGMHHPSDVGFGLLNGTMAVLIARFAAGRQVPTVAGDPPVAASASMGGR